MATITLVQNYIKLSDEEINKVFDENANKLMLTDKSQKNYKINSGNPKEDKKKKRCLPPNKKKKTYFCPI